MVLGLSAIDWFPESTGTQALLLLWAFILSAVIGIEREFRHKAAGARTHILVGLGSALFTLVSAYGFSAVLTDDIVMDPSRIAAQIVTGIGFLGAGVIFVRQNIVSGLTTAASVWVTAAVGMACGAGMPVLATLTVALYLVAVTVIAVIAHRLPRRGGILVYRVRYEDGRGVLRSLLEAVSAQGYESSLGGTRKLKLADEPVIEAVLRFSHPQHPTSSDLVELITGVPGVLSVETEHQEND